MPEAATSSSCLRGSARSRLAAATPRPRTATVQRRYRQCPGGAGTLAPRTAGSSSSDWTAPGGLCGVGGLGARGKGGSGQLDGTGGGGAGPGPARGPQTRLGTDAKGNTTRQTAATHERREEERRQENRARARRSPEDRTHLPLICLFREVSNSQKRGQPPALHFTVTRPLRSGLPPQAYPHPSSPPPPPPGS